MGVEAAFVADELLMGPAGNQAAVLQDLDFAGVADGGKPMRDDNSGAALHQAVKRTLDLLLALAVQRGSRLV